ncbi:MAG: TAXI family TRAP transporter solute-binding subunit [Clostridia bacterium]|nr:TAXI family TRAP transporter solute-binding subunit [Clostridia bacterium]
MKKLLAIALTLVMVLSLTACAGGASEVHRLVMVTGGDAGTYYAFGGVIANVLTENIDNVEITATTSGASAANARSLHNKEADLAILQNDVLAYAVNGTDSMAEDGAMPELRAVASLYPEAVQLVATANSGIKSVQDLKGKKVCVGDAGSGSEVNAKQVLEACGLSYDDFEVQYLSFSEASTAMQNGTVDAAFNTSAMPNAAITELANYTDIVVVPIDGASADALIAKYPFYAKTTITKDIYGTDADVESVAMMAILACTADLDADVVYNITKQLFEQNQALSAHVRGKDVTLDSALDGVTVNFHDGALKYYQEKGINVG